MKHSWTKDFAYEVLRRHTTAPRALHPWRFTQGSKSWLVLDLCVHIAQGSPLWGLDVTRGDVLYLCLEDSERRIQERLNTITDNVPEGMYFATGCTSIESGVCDWPRRFKG